VCQRSADDVSWWLRATFERHTEWGFATLDGAWEGRACVRSNEVVLAWAGVANERPVEVPSYAAAITSVGVHAAGMGELGPSISLAFSGCDEDDEDAMIAVTTRKFDLILVASLVGMAARGSCEIQRLTGWQRKLIWRAPVVPYDGLALVPGTAFDETHWLERTTLDLLAVVRRGDITAREAASASAKPLHYRAPSSREVAHGCTLRDLTSRFALGPLRHIDKVKHDPSGAHEAAMAFRTFAAAQPSVVQGLLAQLDTG
jgi:hypothetical protein